MTLFPDSTNTDWALENRRNLRRLIMAVRASFHTLNLLIAICDNPRYRDELIQSYETELTDQGITCQTIQLNRQQPSLKQSLLDWCAEHPDWEASIPTLITVRGGDELLGLRLDHTQSEQEKFFFSVQWTRESLRAFQLPIVLWVTTTIAQGLAQQAPDFWSWRGGVFEFVQPLLVSPQVKLMSEETIDQPVPDPHPLHQEIDHLLQTDPDSPLLASLYHSLGEVYRQRIQQGKTEQSAKELEQAIAAFQAAIARYIALDQPIQRATSLNNLAELYASQGDDLNAEALYQESLQLREQYLGLEDLETAMSLYNLAESYCAQGRYADAEPLYRRSLEIREQKLGEHHPDVAASLNGLAGLYKSIDRYAEAESLYLRSLNIREQQLGEYHPDVATTMNDLASLYRAMHRYHEAESLLQRVIQIYNIQLGSEHPWTAISLNNLAFLYELMGHWNQAESLYLQSLTIREKVFGLDSTYTAQSFNNLAGLYEEMGKDQQAEELYRRSLAIYDQAYAEPHLDKAVVLNNLAVLCMKQQRWLEAEPLLEQALAIRQTLLKKTDHPRILQNKQQLAAVQESIQSGDRAASDQLTS